MASTEKRADLIAVARELSGVPMCDDYEKMISGMLCVFEPSDLFLCLCHMSRRVVVIRIQDLTG